MRLAALAVACLAALLLVGVGYAAVSPPIVTSGLPPKSPALVLAAYPPNVTVKWAVVDAAHWRLLLVYESAGKWFVGYSSVYGGVPKPVAVLTGAPTAVAVDDSSQPHVLAVGTDRGEVVVVNATSLKPVMRYVQAVPSRVDALEVLTAWNGSRRAYIVAALFRGPAGATLRLMVVGSRGGWAEASPLVPPVAVTSYGGREILGVSKVAGLLVLREVPRYTNFTVRLLVDEYVKVTVKGNVTYYEVRPAPSAKLIIHPPVATAPWLQVTASNGVADVGLPRNYTKLGVYVPWGGYCLYYEAPIVKLAYGVPYARIVLPPADVNLLRYLGSPEQLMAEFSEIKNLVAIYPECPPVSHPYDFYNVTLAANGAPKLVLVASFSINSIYHPAGGATANATMPRQTFDLFIEWLRTLGLLRGNATRSAAARSLVAAVKLSPELSIVAGRRVGSALELLVRGSIVSPKPSTVLLVARLPLGQSPNASIGLAPVLGAHLEAWTPVVAEPSAATFNANATLLAVGFPSGYTVIFEKRGGAYKAMWSYVMPAKPVLLEFAPWSRPGKWGLLLLDSAGDLQLLAKWPGEPQKPLARNATVLAATVYCSVMGVVPGNSTLATVVGRASISPYTSSTIVEVLYNLTGLVRDPPLSSIAYGLLVLHLVDPKGKPVENATILLYRGGELVAEVHGAPQGIVVIAGVAPGVYRVVVEPTAPYLSRVEETISVNYTGKPVYLKTIVVPWSRLKLTVRLVDAATGKPPIEPILVKVYNATYSVEKLLNSTTGYEATFTLEPGEYTIEARDVPLVGDPLYKEVSVQVNLWRNTIYTLRLKRSTFTLTVKLVDPLTGRAPVQPMIVKVSTRVENLTRILKAGEGVAVFSIHDKGVVNVTAIPLGKPPYYNVTSMSVEVLHSKTTATLVLGLRRFSLLVRLVDMMTRSPPVEPIKIEAIYGGRVEASVVAQPGTGAVNITGLHYGEYTVRAVDVTRNGKPLYAPAEEKVYVPKQANVTIMLRRQPIRVEIRLLDAFTGQPPVQPLKVELVAPSGFAYVETFKPGMKSLVFYVYYKGTFTVKVLPVKGTVAYEPLTEKVSITRDTVLTLLVSRKRYPVTVQLVDKATGKAPLVPIAIYVDGKYIDTIPAGQSTATLSLPYGIHALEARPNGTIGVPPAPLYDKAVATVDVKGATSVKLVLDRLYSNATLVIFDMITRRPPIEPVIVKVDGEQVAVVKPSKRGKAAILTNVMLLRGKVHVIEVSGKHVYSKVVKRLKAVKYEYELKIPVPRRTFQLVLNVYDDLGHPVPTGNVRIQGIDIPYRSVIPIADGTMRARLPYGTYQLTIEVPGFYPYKLTVTLHANVEQRIVLKPTPLTIVKRFLPLIVAVIIAAAIIVVGRRYGGRIKELIGGGEELEEF